MELPPLLPMAFVPAWIRRCRSNPVIIFGFLLHWHKAGSIVPLRWIFGITIIQRKVWNPKTEGSNWLCLLCIKMNLTYLLTEYVVAGLPRNRNIQGYCREYTYICVQDTCVYLIYLIYPLWVFNSDLLWLPHQNSYYSEFFFMLLISLKDEPKLNPAVNSSPSSWGKTWITMTQQSSTALSMERTSSSVWKISGRPGKHPKVKKGQKAKKSFPKSAKEFGFQMPWAECAALRRNVLLFSSLGPGLVPFQLPFRGVDSQDFLGVGTSKLFLLHQRIGSCFVPLP